MQFNIDEIYDNFTSSPSVIDVSSESGEKFTVETGNFQALDERFRVVRPDSDVMSAFVGAAAATFFPSSSVSFKTEEVVDTAGSQIERQLMEMIDEHQSHRSSSPTSFIDTEFEESPESPADQEMEDSHSLNSYGRPSAAILPTPRGRGRGRGLVQHPIQTYPPGFIAGSSDFNVIREKTQEVSANNFDTGFTSTQIGLQIANPVMPLANNNNPAPMMIQIPPVVPNFTPVQNAHQMQPVPQSPLEQVFPMQATHSTNVLLLPSSERDLYRLTPTVMPNIAGYCNWCGRTYDQINLETLGDYLLATAYGETVSYRNVRSRAFIDGFEAALFAFKNAGLSQPRSCVGAKAYL